MVTGGAVNAAAAEAVNRTARVDAIEIGSFRIFLRILVDHVILCGQRLTISMPATFVARLALSIDSAGA